MNGSIAGRSLCLAALLAASACATPTIDASTSQVAERLAFLHAGETRIEEVTQRLGAPTFRHDADRTMIWVAPDALVAFDLEHARSRSELVLQFDAAGTYVRGSVVHAE